MTNETNVSFAASQIIDPQWDGKTTFRVPEVAAILNISVSSAWAAVQSGEIGHVRIGKRVIIPRHVVERLLSCA
jgi:excisionase family DNA binding protein